MTRRCHRHIHVALMLVAATSVVLFTAAAALAQNVPVTVEIQGSDSPNEPTEGPTDDPTDPAEQPTDPSREPTEDPSPTDPASPEPPPGEEPPPAAVDPPTDPLPRTGADVLRAVRDAAAMIAAGLLLLIATRKSERTTG